MRKIAFLAGARPNYMKVFPVWKAMKARSLPISQALIHTGQHYDPLMSDVFFSDFEMDKPTHFLGVGSGTHGVQTAKVLIALEELFLKERPDLLVVVGDVNSTMAGTLVAAKLLIPVAHIEAGLRSFDRAMPEEINRIVTDSISDLLLTTCREADEQLVKEGIPRTKIRFVGNVMIDSLVSVLPKARKCAITSKLGLARNAFVLVTLHRPSNVDAPARLKRIAQELSELSERHQVVFPVHPRTKKTLESLGPGVLGKTITTDPLGYMEFTALQADAGLVVTDSGGVQEETSFLGIPCLTVRQNTERPITISQGTNRLINPETESLKKAAADALEKGRRQGPCPIEGWDGKAAERIVDVLTKAVGL